MPVCEGLLDLATASERVLGGMKLVLGIDIQSLVWVVEQYSRADGTSVTCGDIRRLNGCQHKRRLET